jgi:hypothetical protein
MKVIDVSEELSVSFFKVELTKKQCQMVLAFF